MKRVLFLPLFFILVVLILFFYFYLLPKKVERSLGVSLNISGLKEIKAGDKASWIVEIKNAGQNPIKIISLYFQYPLGTFDEKGNLKKKEEITLNKILLPNESFEKTFEGNIFGEVGEQKEASASISYQLQGFTSIYQKKASFRSLLSSTLLSFWFELPKRVSPGNYFELNLFYKSDFAFPLENLILTLVLPKEFKRKTPLLSNEKQEDQTSIFQIGSLNSGEGGKISIEGYFQEAQKGSILFKAALGKLDEKSYQIVNLIRSEQYLSVKEPILNLEVKINGENPPYIARPQENLNFKIVFQNTDQEILENLKLEVELPQDVFDFLQAPGGEIQRNKIVFLPEKIPTLAFLGPYGKGEVGFVSRIKENPGLQRKIIGKAAIGRNIKSFEIKISSKVEAQALLYFNLPSDLQGIFLPPRGNFPPNLGETFEAILVIFIKNQGNELQNAQFKILLPPETRPILDEKFPKDLQVEFNENANLLILNLKSLAANFEGKIGIKLQINVKEMFQSAISKVDFEAKDSFTQSQISLSLPGQTISQIK